MMRLYQEKALDINLTLTAMDCPTCGVVFAVASHFLDKRRRDGAWFSCPAGHQIGYGAGEVDKAKREAMQAKHEADQAKAEAERARRALKDERFRHDLTTRSLSATKGVVTKMRKRAQAGVCPVPGCRRHFGETALTKHLATVHPGWTPETVADTAPDGSG